MSLHTCTYDTDAQGVESCQVCRRVESDPEKTDQATTERENDA